MEIPDSSVGWGLTAFGAVVAWLVRLEARLNARPTRQEQQAMAAEVASDVKGQFAEIKRMLDKQNEQMEKKDTQTALHRDLMSASVAEIRTRVAVLSERSKNKPAEDSGIFEKPSL